VEVVALLVFVSLCLVSLAVGFFVWSVQQGTHEHSDRLALLPLSEDAEGVQPVRKKENQ
jgi:cbb3-type cytochrome oxidase maturation protein